MSTWIHRLFGRSNFDETPRETLDPAERLRQASEEVLLDEPAVTPLDPAIEEDAEDWDPIMEVELPTPNTETEQNPEADEDANEEDHTMRPLSGCVISYALPDYYRQAYHGSICASMVLPTARAFYAGRMHNIGPGGNHRREIIRDHAADILLPEVLLLPDGSLQDHESVAEGSLEDREMAALVDHQPMTFRFVDELDGSFVYESVVLRGFHVFFQELPSLLLDLVGESGFFPILESPGYPLGDEVAAFIDWFTYKTGELIERWNCGNFSIVPDSRKGW